MDFRHPERFLGLDDTASARDSSAVWVLPIPFEMTTSYVGGTRRGPSAIIEASTQVELYDSAVGSEAALSYGIATLPTFHPTLESPEAAFQSITDAVNSLDLEDRLLVTLGGEHSITPGIVRALAPRFPDLVIIQIDAHSDLRDEFDGTPYSHACAMRRSLDYAPVISFGIRSVCQEEADFARDSERVITFTAEALYQDPSDAYLETARRLINGRPIYLTIDLDGLDPSVIPDVGTPEPGGLGWYDCLDLVRTVAEAGNVIAFDCVELCPSANGQQSAFAAAKLVYKTLNFILRARGRL